MMNTCQLNQIQVIYPSTRLLVKHNQALPVSATQNAYKKAQPGPEISFPVLPYSNLVTTDFTAVVWFWKSVLISVKRLVINP